ncbi:LysR substrate-binding domain-containing protein [Nonomuraea sp. NPDC050556]|uniref:LysR substrate-binding domain-containing protein n=1 Tax=Nonomuraea sp. NPDC050556 TaxID=3364369 RepID=UPI0037A7A5F8
MLDLHRLRLLRELKHRGTIAAVAAALSYSPSAVSQQLSKLESEVGARLLEPVGRQVRLTAQAEILVAHAEAILQRVEQAEADVAASVTGITGTLRVAAFQTAMISLVPTALRLLRAAHPALRVEVAQAEPETSLPALLARDVDLAITEEYPGHPAFQHPGLERHELHEDPIRLAADAPLHELSDRPWIMEPAGSAARLWAVGLCRTAGFEPDVLFDSADLLVHVRFAEEGHAVALLPDLVWHGRTPTVALRGLGASRALYVSSRSGAARHPAVQACRTALREAITG